MNRLRWHIRTWKSRLGREGIAGIGLLGVSLAFYLFALRPAALNVERLHAQIANLTRHEHTAPAQSRTDVKSPSDQLASYYGFFPPQTSTPDALAKIYQAARQQNIDLVEGKYRPKPERAGRLLRYQITLPVTGTYRQVREFLSLVLARIPNAALDDVVFERRKIGESSVEAKITLSLYLVRKT